jgi:hypothetical protein
MREQIKTLIVMLAEAEQMSLVYALWGYLKKIKKTYSSVSLLPVPQISVLWFD